MESQLNFLKLTSDKLDVGAINDLVADDACGAISSFVGTTRNNFEDKKVLTLEYVAYEPMALKMMNKICDHIREKWDDIFKIAIYHRLGLVPVKEASVVIAISSPHRQASLEAVQYAIEELKKVVPIWKKEKYTTQEPVWKENKECSGIPNISKRCKFDFDDCPLESQSISQNLVQVGANEKDIVRRIQCFVEKKREEIDHNNIMDFTAMKRTRPDVKTEESEENLCARTNGVFIKQVDSKGHLRVRRVKNRIGPQIKPDYLQALDKLMKNEMGTETQIKEEKFDQEEDSKSSDLPLALNERLQNIESHLNMKVINPKHVFERIKGIENKILYLESISPEYKHFLMDKPSYVQQTPSNRMSFPPKKKVYTVEEIDVLIEGVKADIEREEQKLKAK